MSKKTLAIFFLIVLILLIILLILYGSKLIDSFSSQNQAKTKSLTRADISMIKIQLNDAEAELIKLKELAEDQESLAKIEILSDQVNFYRTETGKPFNEIKKDFAEDFYNAGIWEMIVKLKNKIGNNGESKEFLPQLE